MSFDRPIAVRARRSCAALPLLGALLTISAGVAVAEAGTKLIVSQRGRAFLPGALSIHRGDTVEVVNDDGDLMHHAYVDDPAFSFDSGDQEPGAKADIVFTKGGTFDVLCGIHPKMRLVVTVRD